MAHRPFQTRKFVLVLLLAFIIAAPLAWGQSASTAALAGTVTDPTGAVIPNVTVTATSAATNQARTVVTSADGSYRFPLLEPGAYRVRFTSAGFKASEVTGMNLVVTETATLDRALEVGAQSEQVTVEANVETVQTATSTLGTTVTGNTITSLPLSTRNFTQVLGMSTGVAVDAANGSAFGRGSQNMSVNGADPSKNNFQMDGVSINNAAGGNNAGDAGLYTGIAIPSPDALQEFKIQTSTYDASFGRNPGANVNVVTKSGTNRYTGTLFEFFRNEALNANDFFYNRDSKLSQTQKQVLKQNQFGGVLGGPIKKDKLFFFGSYQGTRQRNGLAAQGFTNATLYPLPGGDRGTTSLAGVDDAAAAAFRKTLGNNMCVGGAGPGFATRAGTIPLSCTGSNTATAAGINDVAMRIMQVKLADGTYYVPGSGVTPGAGVNGAAPRFFSTPGKYTENQYLANVDWLASAKHTLQAKYMFSGNPFEYQLSGTFGLLPGDTTTDRRSNTSAVLRLTSILSPTIVNQARGSFQRVIQDGSDIAPYTAQQVGMRPLISSACCNGTTGGTYTQPPLLNLTGAFVLGGTGNPAFAPSNQTQWADQLSWTKGAHTMRAGFEYENIRYPLVFGGLGRGRLFMASFQDFLVGRASCAPSSTTCTTGNPGNTTGSTSLSSFTACQFCVRSSVNGIIHNYNLHNINAFFQDDWKVNTRLSVNVGVRWEYNGTLRDKYGNLTNWWASDVASVPTASVPSANSVLDAIATLGSNPNAFKGYVLPSNYDTRAIIDGGHGPVPPGVRVFNGEFASTNGIPLSNFGPRIGFAWTPLASNKLVVRGGAGIFYDRLGINNMVHAVQEGRPYADTTSIQPDVASLASPYQDRPLQLLPRWFNFNTLTGSGFNSPFYDRLETPLVRQYNLGIQYEFLPSYVLEMAYVGSSGINIGDYNHIINTAGLVCTALVTSHCVNGSVNGFTTNTAANAQGRVPYLGFFAYGFEQNAFDGVYNYNSLQTTVRKNFSRGLGMQASYTWNKNMSTVGFVGANLNDPTNLGQQYGQTPYSRPHRFVLSYQYELPYKTGNSMLSKVAGGWAASGLTTVQAGNPLTIFDTRGGAVWGLPHSNAIEDNVTRANFASGITFADLANSGDLKARLGGASGGTGFFNRAAFIAPPVMGNDGSLGFGNSGVGVIRGPHQLNFDFSANKTIRISESKSFQLRADFFNLFNHAQFAMPSTSVGSGQTQANSASFGSILNTSVNPRLVQFALRFAF